MIVAELLRFLSSSYCISQRASLSPTRTILGHCESDSSGSRTGRAELVQTILVHVFEGVTERLCDECEGVTERLCDLVSSFICRGIHLGC